MWRGGTRPLNLNPATGDWPGLPFYLTLGSQMAYRAYDFVRAPSSAASFEQRMEARPAGIFLAARIASVAVALVSLWWIYGLGIAVGGRSAGLLAAAYVAVMPVHVSISQRVFDPNLLSFAFITAAALSMLRAVRSLSIRDSVIAGVLVGLGGASKYLPFVMLAPLVLAHVQRSREARGLQIRWRPLGLAIGAAVIAFALTSPFTILDAQKLADMREQSLRLRSEWAGLSSPLGTLGSYLVQTMPEMMTWPGYLLALAGAGLLLRRGREGVVLLTGPILFFIGLGTLGQAQPRFVVPIVGILAVASAFAVIAIGERVRGAAGQRIKKWLVPAATAAIVVWGLTDAASTRARLALPDSRHVAHAWVVQSIPLRVPLALDTYGPVVLHSDAGRCATEWPFHTWQADYVKGAFHPEWLDGIRYYVTSSEVARRYEGSDPRYAAERDFYRWIRSNGRRVWSSDPHATFGPQIDVWALPQNVSSAAQRDSLWAKEPRHQTSGRDIPRWTADLAQDFLVARDLAHAEEWARRGLSVGGGSHGEALYQTLAAALIDQGKAQEAEVASREAIASFPGSPVPHVFRAMALEAMGRRAEALAEYRVALPLTSMEDARRFVGTAIARLGG
jgi:hypothetical protein